MSSSEGSLSSLVGNDNSDVSDFEEDDSDEPRKGKANRGRS